MKSKKENKQEQLPTAFSAMANQAGEAKIEDIAEYMGVSRRTVERYIKNQDELVLNEGFIAVNPNK